MNNEIFVIGCWVDSREKEQNLISVIKDLKSKNYPVCLAAHCPISKEIQELVDYYVYEKENVLSLNWKLVFWRMRNGVREEKPSLVDYHGVACLMNIRNSIDLLLAKEKFQYIHYREADLEYDFDSYMKSWNERSEASPVMFVHYQDNRYRTDLFSCEADWYNLVIPRVQSWQEYTDKSITNNLILEYWFSDIVDKMTKQEHITFIKDFQVGNKWTQAHYVEWDDDPRPKLDFADAPNILFESKNRQDSFKKVLELLYKNKNEMNPNIVEVGVTRILDNVIDGDSTSIWSWYISKYGGNYHGCDVSRDSLKIAETVLRRYIGANASDRAGTVALTCKDGLEFLKSYNKPIDLLYLDTCDWVKGSHESGLYHLQLTLEAIDKVKIGGFLMFDDTFNVDTFEGKAELAIPYLLGSKQFTCIHRGYQFIFRRDI